MKALKPAGTGANFRTIKRCAVAVGGGAVTIAGVAMIVLPGPAIVVIPVGLSILATEFQWAERWLGKAHAFAARLKSKALGPSH